MTSIHAARLFIPRYWLFWSILLLAVTFIIGICVKLITGLEFYDLNIGLNSAHSGFADQIALLLDMIDHVTVVAVILLVLLIVGGLTVGWLRAIGACIAIGLGWVSTLVIKAVIAEPRPNTNLLPHKLDIEAATQSFPSGHVVFTAALVTGLMFLFPSFIARVVIFVVGLVLVVAVGWSRLYLGVHYPADVLAGVLNGVGGAMLIAGLWNLALRYIRRN